MQSRITDINAAGVEVIAVSVDSVVDNKKVVDKLGLGFPILSDPSGQAIRAWGVAHEGGGMGGTDIARPATFLIGEDGTVVWRELTENWRVRVRPDHVLEAISSLNEAAPTKGQL